MRGAERSKIAEWLAELWLITAKREGDDSDFRARIMALAIRLEQFPGDLVKRAIIDWRGRFFPTYEEIYAAIDWRALRLRSEMIRALEDGVPPPKPRVTPEQAAAIRARYAAPVSRETAPGETKTETAA